MAYRLESGLLLTRGDAEHDAALAVAKDSARIVVCGMIAGYNDELPSETMHHLSAIVIKRLSLRGFDGANVTIPHK